MKKNRFYIKQEKQINITTLPLANHVYPIQIYALHDDQSDVHNE